MQTLVNARADWKYFLNLVGQEFPLKTNLQLVKILQTLDGANIIHGSLKRSLFAIDNLVDFIATINHLFLSLLLAIRKDCEMHVE